MELTQFFPGDTRAEMKTWTQAKKMDSSCDNGGGSSKVPLLTRHLYSIPPPPSPLTINVLTHDRLEYLSLHQAD